MPDSAARRRNLGLQDGGRADAAFWPVECPYGAKGGQEVPAEEGGARRGHRSRCACHPLCEVEERVFQHVYEVSPDQNPAFYVGAAGAGRENPPAMPPETTPPAKKRRISLYPRRSLEERVRGEDGREVLRRVLSAGGGREGRERR